MMIFRPLCQTGPARPAHAQVLAGGWCWFTDVEVIERGHPSHIRAAADIPADALERLTAPRAPLAGLALDRPRLMGIVNCTPDSFSDGGLFQAPDAALAQARAMIAAGADLIDIGGESTRPGAEVVPAEVEIARTEPVITAVRAEWQGALSIDTRKADVARAALAAGATMLNDVSALRFDPVLGEVARDCGAPLCLMHAQGTPDIMQAAPHYDDVLLDVHDFLAERIDTAIAAGVARERIVIDPGIGFGKTVAHNLALLARISAFHDLGCAVLLGASRKRFIGTLTGVENAADRLPGSLAVALAALAQGVQILRVHDMAETKHAVAVWMAATMGRQA